MPLDPSIIMGAQPMQIQNPLDSAVKAMTLRDLSLRGQTEAVQAQTAQQDFNDNQALRSATANNTKIGPDGTPTLDQAGVLKDLGTSSPSMVPKVAMQYASQRMEMQNQQIKNYSEKMGMAGQLAGSVNSQASLDQLHVAAKSMGLPTDQIPTVYDPNETPGVMQMLQNRAMSAKDQADQHIAQQKLGIEQQDLDVKRSQFQDTKQSDAFKDLMAHAESSRQLPDVKQAYSDRYNAQKVLDLVGQADPNKLSPNMVQLVSGEVAKIAQGGVPQTEALQNITPNDRNMLLSKAKQYMTSHPEASQQGAFVKVFKDYATTIQSGANKVINSNLGALGSMYKDHIKDSDYQNYQNTVVKGTPGGDQQGAQMVDIKLPDGRTGTIPKSNLDKAILAGASRI